MTDQGGRQRKESFMMGGGGVGGKQRRESMDTSGRQRRESMDISEITKREVQKNEEWKKKARESFVQTDSESDDEKNLHHSKEQRERRQRRTRSSSSSFNKDDPINSKRRPSIASGDTSVAPELVPTDLGGGSGHQDSKKQESKADGNEERSGEGKINVDRENGEDEDNEEEGEEEEEEEDDETESTSSSISDQHIQEAASSFKHMLFKSEEVKDAIKTHFAMDQSKKKIRTQTYDSKTLFPDWMLSDPAWTNSNADTTGVHISQILQKSVSQRTSDENSTLVKWLMSVWGIAEKMGFRRCSEMAKSFKYIAYQEGDDILIEGERGLTFYIIVSGTVAVIKNGIGKVAALGLGKSFGEIALLEGDKEGKDVRTATIRAETKVEIINLHKLDYDRFVKEIQAVERRENFQAFRECKLFKTWSRSRVEKVSQSAIRKNFAAGEYIFRQGTEPNSLYIILEGTVSIIKEILIVNRNKWPTALNEWSGVAKKTVSSFLQAELSSGDFFGETGIMHNLPRNASILTKTPVLVVCLGRDEFLHMLGPNSFLDVDKTDDNPVKLLNDVIDRVNGGPSSTVSYGGHTFRPKASKEIQEKEKADVEKASKLALAKQRRRLASGTFNPEASVSTSSTGLTKKPRNKKNKSSREQKFGERFYKDVTRREEQVAKFVGIGAEAVKLSKARKEFLSRVQVKNKTTIPAADVSIHEIVSMYKKREDTHKSHSRSLSFSDLNGKEAFEGASGEVRARAKTAGGVGDEGGSAFDGVGPESMTRPLTTSLPRVNTKQSKERSHTSGEAIGRRNVVFSTVDRGLRINRGLRLGGNSENYRPLSATLSHRVINSTSGRIIHDTAISNLDEYDEKKVIASE